MKTIAVCQSPHEADLLISRLENEGLRVCLVDEFSTALGMTGGSGMKVAMHEDDLPRYRQLVEEDAGLRHLLRIELPACPRCESRTIRAIKPDPSFLTFLVDLLSVFGMRSRDEPTHRCHRCGYAGKRDAFDVPHAASTPESDPPPA